MATHPDNMKAYGKFLSIGSLAGLSGFSPATIRFYEKQGLIEVAPRSLSGFRQYSGNEIRRLKFIRRAKQLGFTLSEIKELLGGEEPGKSWRQARRQIIHKLKEVKRKRNQLEKIMQTLMTLLKRTSQ